ncbi:MAG: hypothetical protein ACOH2V_00455 [Candidatus Saccharimonadaceae bacterium]
MAESIRQKLTKQISNCKFISINGVAYFGTLNKGLEATTLENAVESQLSVSETARIWLKQNNLNNLQSLEISGDVAFVVRELTASQEIEIELVVLTAAQAATNAVPELINSKF